MTDENDQTPRAEDYVGQLPLLVRLPKEDRQVLAARAHLRSFATGAVIMREGEPGDSLHVIMEGRVNIVAARTTGHEVMVAIMGPGDCFGEMSIVDGLPRSASAIAASPTRTFMVTRETFVEWVSERPAAALAIMETLSGRIRAKDQTLLDLVSLDLARRLVKQLLSRASTLDLETVLNNGTLRLQVTQGDLALMLGVTRESVNKALKQFQADGWVKTSRGAITITDMAALRRLS